MKHRQLYILGIAVLASCFNVNESERTKAIIAELKQEYKDDYRHISLDTSDVVYISGMSFNEIRNSITTNVYCGKCDNAYSIMIPDEFYFDLESITITFKGICARCQDSLQSGYAMHKRIDYLVKTLEKRKHT